MKYTLILILFITGCSLQIGGGSDTTVEQCRHTCSPNTVLKAGGPDGCVCDTTLVHGTK